LRLGLDALGEVRRDEARRAGGFARGESQLGIGQGP